MADRALATHKVWDAPTRWFHWINVVCVFALLSQGFLYAYRELLSIQGNEPKFALMTLHVWVGYVFVTNLTIRIVWSFFGNRHARWRSVLPGRRTFAAAVPEFRALMARRPYIFVGRSPISRLTVTALFAALILQAGTGLTRAGIDLYYPPVGPIVAAFIAKPGVDPAEMTWRNAQDTIDGYRYGYVRPIKFLAGDIHRYNAYLLIVLIILHILTSVLTEVRQTSGVISAMFSGRVTAAGPEARRGGARPGPESSA